MQATENFGDIGVWPANNAALGVTAVISGSFVTDVSSANGVITVTYGNKANAAALSGSLLTIRPSTSTNNDVAWVCGTSAVPGSSSVIGIDATNVAPKYLPSSCRA